MSEKTKTPDHLIRELEDARRRIAELEAGVAERKRAEEALRKLSLAVEQSPSVVMITDTEGNIEYVNPKFAEVTGYTPEEVIGQNPRILKSGKVPPEVYREMWETITSGEEWRGELLNKTKDGELYWDSMSISPIRDPEGVITHFLAVKENITGRKRAEEELEASLREKTLLLHEVNHRVKNNLQIISSLLSMSGRRTSSPEALGLIRDCKARIQTMALIHSELYSSGDFERIDLGEMARKLLNHLLQAYGQEGTRVRPVVLSGNVLIPLSQAIPCALAINELLTNALRHAFVGRAEGALELNISEDADGRIRVVVEDDGVGMPADVDVLDPSSLGLGLVRDLVLDQLKGTLELGVGQGTTICFEFYREGEDHHA